MVKLINNTNPKYNMKWLKNIFGLLMVLLFSSLMVNATIYSDNQEDNFIKLGSNSILSTISPDLLTNDTLSVAYELTLTTTDTYLVFTSQTGTNESIDFDYNIGNGWVSTHYQVLPNQTLYLAFTPQVVNDNAYVQISHPTGNIGWGIISFNDNERGINDRTSIFTPMITGVTDLININISIWKIVYYLFIMIIVIGFIAGIIYLGYKWYQFTDKHSIYGNKSKHSNYKK